MSIITISFPIFLIILVGYVASKFHILAHNATDLLTRLLFYIVMPITLFFDIAKLPIAQTLAWNYMGSYFLSSIVIITISVMLSRSLFNRNTPNLIINAMASTHTNTAYLALPLFLIIYKTVTPVASIIIVQTLFNFLILFGLDVSTNRSSRHANHYAALLVIFENPILLGTLLGLAFSYFHVVLPEVIYSSCSIVSQSASFIALFALGLSLGIPQLALNRKQKYEISILVILKTLIHPLVAFLIGYYLFDLSGFLLTALTLMAAMPTAKNLFVFARRYQVGSERANIIVLITTIVSIVTISLILLASHSL